MKTQKEKSMKTQMAMLSSLSLLLAASSACSQVYGETYFVIIDSSFDTDYQIAIEEAIHNWEGALGENIRISSVSIGLCTGGSTGLHGDFGPPMRQICIRKGTEQETHDRGCAGPNLGCSFRDGANDSGETILPIDEVSKYLKKEPSISFSQLVQQITAHEIGHDIGLSHTQGGSLMFWETNKDQAEKPTCSDVAQYFSLRGITSFKTAACPNGGEFTLSNAI